MGHYKPSEKYRYAIAEKLEQGYTLKEAEDEVFKGNSNKSRHLKLYNKRGFFPYGMIDPPPKPKPPPTVVPAMTHRAAQESVVKENDAVLMNRIKTVVNEVVDFKLKAIEVKLRSTSGVVQFRPKLKRTLKNATPVSFRLPKELVKRAKDKAKHDPIGSMGLNAIVESLLFQYIGSPKDLLE